jgi:hypothetical protein
MPSSLRDSTRRRKRAAKRGVGLGTGWVSRLEPRGPLVLYTINAHNVPDLTDLADDPHNLYRARSVQRIKVVTDALFQGVAHRVKIEWHPAHGLHVHVVAPSLEVGVLHRRRNVDDLPGLASYLSKPGDARATRPKPHTRAWTDAEKLEARRVYFEARAALWKRKGKAAKLPRLAWFRDATRG